MVVPVDVDDDAPPVLVHLLPVGEADWHSRAVAWLVMAGRRRGGGRRADFAFLCAQV